MSGNVASVNDSSSRISYVNPVYDGYFADPFVYKVGGSYYAIGTGNKNVSPDRVFQVLRSPDLVNWTSLGYALKVPAGFEGGDFWAPEVTQRGSQFYMYYSVGRGDKGHHIRVAVADHPEGPYEDAGRLTPEDLPFAIDAHVYRHTDGEEYLYYAVDILDSDRPGTSLVVDRLVSPTQLEGNPHTVARATADWQRYEADRSIYDGVYDWHTLEGPTVVHKDGKIYVLYSGGNWQNESYGVDFVVADHPLGPYVNETVDHPRALSTVEGLVFGPGHNSVILGPDGKTYIAVYHAWDKAKTARLMRIDPIRWTEDGPVIDGPSLTDRTT